MHPQKKKHNIGIFLPPSPRGPGMIKSPALDVANMVAVLKEEAENVVRLFDLRSHVIAGDPFWIKKKVDLSVFNDLKQCINHVLVKRCSGIDDVVEKILKEVAVDNIDFMVFFVSIIEQFSLQYLTSALCIAFQLKKRNPSIKIIFSGNCPKKHIRQILCGFKFLDAFLEDGNEFTILEYIKKFKTGKALKGVIYREQNKLILPGKSLPLQLNKYPVPDFSLFDLEIYKSNGRIVLPYELSRGCINNCFFCYYIYKGGKIYKKSFEKTVKDLIYLRRKYHVSTFHFVDAEINFDKNYLRKFCTELLSKKANILWSALAIPADLDYNLLKLLKESGCVQLRFGVESGGSSLLKIINKKTAPLEMSQVLKDAHHAGIHTYVTLIKGLPQERQADVRDTIAFLHKNKNFIDSVDICDYGQLGYVESQVLDNLLSKKETTYEVQKSSLSGKALRDYSKKIGLKESDVIDDFLSKIEHKEAIDL